MTSKSYFKQLNLLMGAMIAGLVLFALVATFLITSEGPLAPAIHAVFQYLAPAIALGSMVGSYFFFKERLKMIPPDAGLTAKMNGYRSAKIIAFALLDGGAMFSVIGYLMAGHWLYLASAGFVLLVFLLGRPSPQQAVNDLELMGEEAFRVQNPEEIIADVLPN